MNDQPLTVPVIIDAGPALNFFSTNHERLLLSVVGGYLQAPETVLNEVQRRSRDPRFKAAPTVTQKLLAAGRITQLSDDVTPELSAVCSRLTGLPLPQRLQQAKDLGELMVIAHAVVQAEQGRHVTMLIDDGDGHTLAALETARLERLRRSRPNLGTLRITSTVGILLAARGSAHLPDRASAKKVYAALSACDDGLGPIGKTGLLDPERWT